MLRRIRLCLPVALVVVACRAPGLTPTAQTGSAPDGPAMRVAQADWGGWDEGPPVDATRYYPDLKAIAPRYFYLERRTSSRPLLRFATAIGNAGPGHLQVRGTIEGRMTRGTQEIVDEAGRILARKDVGTFELHDDHGHFHVTGVARYELRRGDRSGPLVQRGRKISFCMEDSVKVESSAGPSRIPLCTRTIQGITRGYVDVYSADLPEQFFDMGPLASGEYTIVIQLDPTRKFLEASRSNNLAWLRLRYDARARTIEKVAAYP